MTTNTKSLMKSLVVTEDGGQRVQLEVREPTTAEKAAVALDFHLDGDVHSLYLNVQEMEALFDMLGTLINKGYEDENIEDFDEDEDEDEDKDEDLEN